MNTVERKILLLLRQSKEVDAYKLYIEKHYSPAQISQFLLKYIPKGYVYKRGNIIRRTLLGRIMISTIPVYYLLERGEWKDIPTRFVKGSIPPNQPCKIILSSSQRHRIISKSEM